MKSELDTLLAKRDKMHMDHMNKYRNHSATRAQTTTHNARVTCLNEQIMELREAIKHA